MSLALVLYCTESRGLQIGKREGVGESERVTGVCVWGPVWPACVCEWVEGGLLCLYCSWSNADCAAGVDVAAA